MKENNLDSLVLYKYGLYVNSIVADIKGLDKKQLAYKYENLPIKELNEIKITGDEIIELLNIEPGKEISKIFSNLENKILLGELENDNQVLRDYINYS
jgi:tRNA nucleotidyltransferase/poly(A) polymerase